uniref:SpoIID/LytB domain-containing protein n=1 Tax=uncultured bacterium W4-21b TaxID=1130993 RepID=H9BWN9_9BACT|nr:SpoIID/LytB domain-containing protein [uncultured bacterium W4-21b]
MQYTGDLKIVTKSPYRVEMIQSRGIIAQGAKLSQTKLRAMTAGFLFGGKPISLYGFRLISQEAPIWINGEKYPNKLKIFKDAYGKITVVHEMDLEEYLTGVLPNEIWANWPDEVLKAQAVASRTYALYESLIRFGRDYSSSGDVRSQIFRVNGQEAPSINEAVETTKGEVLTYKGEIFPTYFHSHSGGRTTRPEYVWPVKPHPALKGVLSPFARNSKHYRWEAKLESKEIEKRLKNKGYVVGTLSEIIPIRIDESGRAREIFIRHSRGTLKIRGNNFRMAVGPDKIKSLKDLKIERQGGQFVFQGYGWGHGVGMSQWGARDLADRGFSYRRILRFYYPRTEIVTLKDIVEQT